VTRSKGWRLASYAVVAVSLWFFGLAVSRNIGNFASVPVDGPTMIRGIGLVVAHVLITGAAGSVWYLLIRALGQETRYRDCVAIFAISQFAKYIPGNVAHQIGRVVIGTSLGIDASRTVVSLFLEGGIAIAASGSIALVAVITEAPDLLDYLARLPFGWIASALILGVGLAGGVTALIWRHRPSVMNRLFPGGLSKPRARIVLLAFVANITMFWGMGLIVHGTAVVGFQTAGGGILYATAVFSGAWIVGFLTPGAPAGLGVREAIMISLLGPVYGEAAAIGVSIALRLITMLGDTLAFVIGIGLKRGNKPAT
jgi:glycosyltransferase 2 family protein